MRRPGRRPHPRGGARPRDDRGSTLVAAVLVASVTLLLAVVVLTQSVAAVRSSGQDRQRTAQVHAAEAGIDEAYHRLQTGVPTCAEVRLPTGGSPDTTEVRTTVAYFSATGASVNPCTSATVPVRAVISATATSANSVGAGASSARTFESGVLLSPSSGGAGYAIYSYDAFTVPNSFDLSGDGVAPPDVYARGGFMCSNSATADGNVFVPRAGASLGNSCTIGGSLRARDAITMANSSRVDADAYSSRGGLTLTNTASVGRDATVYGSFSGTRAKVGGTLTAQNGTGAALADPADQPLVYVGYDPAPWQAAGFTVDASAGTNCELIKTRMLAATSPTVYYGSCRMTFSGNNAGLKLKTDVALFLTGGLSISNNFGLSSDTADARRLWVISPAGGGAEPAGWTPASCTGGTIDAGNRTDFDPSIHLFVYSCGGISMSNSSTFHGQLYGKRVTVANSFRMTFVSQPPQGVDLGGQPALPGYAVEVVYKRETQNP